MKSLNLIIFKVFKRQLDPNSNLIEGILTFTIEELENLKNYGRVLFIDGTFLRM